MKDKYLRPGIEPRDSYERPGLRDDEVYEPSPVPDYAGDWRVVSDYLRRELRSIAVVLKQLSDKLP